MNMVIKRLSIKILFACSLPLLPFFAFAQEDSDGVSSSSAPQVEMLEEDDFQIEIAEVGGVLKICGVSFGINSKNVHKAVVLDIACPTENPELTKTITKELFGSSSDDIKKACRDYLSDVQTGKNKVDIKGSVLKLFCNCLCYQKGRVFSGLIGSDVFGVDIVSDLTLTRGRGCIYDLTKDRFLTLEDVFENAWLDKQAKKIRQNSDVFLSYPSNELLIFIMPEHAHHKNDFKSPSHVLVAKKNIKHLHSEFVDLIDWDNPPLLLYEGQIDIPLLIKDVEMMNK